MGYSKKEETLINMLPQLESLQRLQPCAWVVQTGTPDQIAYKIREALYIAALPLFRGKYPKLAQAYADFAIELDGPNKVIARRLATAQAAVAGIPQQTAVHGMETVERTMPIPGSQTEFTIIDSWNKSQPRTSPMHFVGANLSHSQLTSLFNWSEAHIPQLMILVNDGSVTLGHCDPQVEEFRWTPDKTK